jgi:hypothetical protein
MNLFLPIVPFFDVQPRFSVVLPFCQPNGQSPDKLKLRNQYRIDYMPVIC